MRAAIKMRCIATYLQYYAVTCRHQTVGAHYFHLSVIPFVELYFLNMCIFTHVLLSSLLFTVIF